MTAVLKRVRIIENAEDGGNKESITPDRAALIRFILNRNNKGGSMFKRKIRHRKLFTTLCMWKDFRSP
jgi:hypothetical protein